MKLISIILFLIGGYLLLTGQFKNLLILILIVGGFIAIGLIWHAILERKANKYFNSEEFKNLLTEIKQLVDEHNDIKAYVDEIGGTGVFDLAQSETGRNAHLATFTNTSRHGYRRDRNKATYAPHVYNASLQVVRNASQNPVKYFCKYFDVKPNVETLRQVEQLAEGIERTQAAISNLKQREEGLRERINPPSFILNYFKDRFWDTVGVEFSEIEVSFQEYRIEYVSAGGNSSQHTSMLLDVPMLEAVGEFLAERIKWAKSAAGQRALMTAKLRELIKERDGYACRLCGVSVEDEPHLLLEVDHVLPVSRGGLSVPENLQTLCWRCNRSKGAKVSDEDVS